MADLHVYADTRKTMRGHPAPISLKTWRPLVLPPELYEALYSPQPVPTSPPKSFQGADGGFVVPATTPGSTAALRRLDNRLTTFAMTHLGSGTEWESEPEITDEHIVTAPKMCPTGMSDEDWDADELDMGYHPTGLPNEELPPYHPTTIVADEPPPLDEEQIEGAQGTLEAPVIAPGQPSPTAVNNEARQGEDDAFKAERCYGVPDPADNDVVLEGMYYEGDEEELDYDDDLVEERDVATERVAEVRDMDRPPEEPHQEADECEDMDAPESVTPMKERLNTPEKDMTDTETGETASLMKSVLLMEERESS